MHAGKKPIHLAMVGGKLPRQLMWEAIRALAKGAGELSTYNVARRSGQDDEAVRDYLRSLAKAGIVRQLQVRDRDATWELLQDEGAEAPAVNKKGERLQTSATECIWRGLRILGELTAAAAVEQAQAGGAVITQLAAQRYLQGLCKAGYVARSGGNGSTPALYRLLPGRNSGPLHPVHQRRVIEQVYDPNTDEVVWAKELGQ